MRPRVAQICLICLNRISKAGGGMTPRQRHTNFVSVIRPQQVRLEIMMVVNDTTPELSKVEKSPTLGPTTHLMQGGGYAQVSAIGKPIMTSHFDGQAGGIQTWITYCGIMSHNVTYRTGTGNVFSPPRGASQVVQKVS